MVTPAFNSKKIEDEWKSAVSDILSSASDQVGSSPAELRRRANDIGSALSKIPQEYFDKSLKGFQGELSKIKKSIGSLSDDKSPENIKRNEKAAKILNEKFEKIEKKLAARVLSSNLTSDKELFRENRYNQEQEFKKFKQQTREQSSLIAKQLSKKILEVTERQESGDSESLQAVKRDLVAALKALKADDLREFKKISSKLNDLAVNYDDISEDMAERFGEIEELVSTRESRRKELHDKIHRYVGAPLERGADYFGLGGVVRGVKFGAKAARLGYKGVRGITRSVARGAGKLRSLAGKALSALRGRSLSSARSLTSPSPSETSDSSADREENNKQQELSWLKRQALAMEALVTAFKKRGDNGSGEGGLLKKLLSGGLLKKLLGRGLGSLKGLAGPLSKMGKAGAQFLGPILGKMGLLAGAAYAGWEVGGFVYDTFAEQIQDGIETVVGVVQKTIDFVSRGIDWFKGFLTDPLSKIKDMGASIQEAWNNSVFGKLFKDPGKLLSEGVGSLLDSVTGMTSSGKKYIAGVAGKAWDAASSVGSSALSSVSSLASSAGSVVSSTLSSAGDMMYSGFSSIRDAVGKLFNTGAGVDLDNLNPAVQSNFVNMAAEYKARGGTGQINVDSGYRSYDKQASLFRQNPNLAAPPGRSSHEQGLALDINSSAANQLDAMGLLDKYGFSRPVPGETWHLQAKGTASVMSSKGIYSGDNPNDQIQATLRRGTSSAAPEVASIPNPLASGTTNTGGQSPIAATPAQSSSSSISSFQGSVSNIPTFSYLDNGFFLMNTGVIAN